MAKSGGGFRVPQESEPATLRPKRFLPTSRTLQRGRLRLLQRPTKEPVSKALGRSECQRFLPSEVRQTMEAKIVHQFSAIRPLWPTLRTATLESGVSFMVR